MIFFINYLTQMIDFQSFLIILLILDHHLANVLFCFLYSLFNIYLITFILKYLIQIIEMKDISRFFTIFKYYLSII